MEQSKDIVAAWAAAEQLVADVGILRPPIDVAGIASHLGLELVEMTLPPWFYGVLMRVDGDTYVVLNRGMPQETRTFTLAHEIAHLVMHGEQLCYMKNRLRPYFHKEADAFAAALTMPSHLVLREIERNGIDCVALAKRFSVSHVAMIRRLEELGHLSPGLIDWKAIQHRLDRRILGDWVP